MAFPRVFSVALETSTGGAVTAYTPHVHGEIVNLIYVKTDFVNGVDFVITTEKTLQTVWAEDSVDAAKTVSPRQATHGTDGIAATYDDVGGNAVNGPVYAVVERIKIVIANGGSVKTGVIKVIVV